MVEEAWKVKSHRNIHFAFYEDLKEHPKEEIKRLDDFLQTQLSEQQVDNVTKELYNFC